jgi:hypothetical protein
MNTAAVIVAAIALISNRRQFEKELLHLEQEKRNDISRIEWEEATGVYAWITHNRDHVGRFNGLVLNFTNLTNFPVYEWKITDGNGTLHLLSERLGPVPPGTWSTPVSDPTWTALGEDAPTRIRFSFRVRGGGTATRTEDGSIHASP